LVDAFEQLTSTVAVAEQQLFAHATAAQGLAAMLA
jgi:hypothetical protein